MLSLNVYIDNWCEGCKFHKYPYKAKIPTKSREIRVFKSDEDVLNVVKLIVAETKEMNETMGKEFDIISSTFSQLSLFCCRNFAINKKSQRDIAQYSYCKNFNTSAFPGSYGQQPNRWISKVNIIESVISKRQEQEYKKAKQQNTSRSI